MNKIEPYRLFFPLGWLLGLLGGVIWIPWFFQFTEEYPGLHHPDIMIGGFLMTYSLGFLTTAIPHFTSTQMMSVKEKVSAFFILGILIFSFFLQIKALTHLTEFFLILFLFYFAGRRYLGRSNNPPPTFIFIGIGLFLGAIGSMLLMLLDLGFIENNFLVIAKSTFYTGFMLSLIIGIGSRLIPALMGHQPIHPPVGLPKENSFWRLISGDIKFLAFTFVLSFLFDLSDTYGFVGHILRLIMIFYVAIKYWKLYMLPRNKGFMYILLWLSSWSMVVGQFMLAFFPSLQLQSLHLLFVSGFGLLTIMISTRVTLAHGGFPLFPEKNSLAILFSGIFILVAALLRFIGPLAVGQYENLLLFSSITWSLALIIWLARFGAHWPKADSVH